MKIARQKPDNGRHKTRGQTNSVKFSKQKTGRKSDDARRRGGLVKVIRQKDRACILFWISIALIVLASCTLLFIPQAGKELLEGKKITAFIIAILFWGLEISAYLIQGFIARACKKAAFRREVKRSAGRKFRLDLMIAFCLAGFALAGLIVLIALGLQDGIWITLSAALLLSASQAGILLSSKNYNLF